MGNCCAQGNLFWENSHQFIYQNETTGSEGKETKLYNQNKNPNLIRTIKEQAEIISEDDFETILQSNFPNLNRIVYVKYIKAVGIRIKNGKDLVSVLVQMETRYIKEIGKVIKSAILDYF